MYTNIYKHIVEASIAREFDSPMHQTKDGRICGINKAHSFKATYKLIHSDYYLVADELGGNIL